MIPDVTDASTVLIVPGIQPGAVDPEDFLSLGSPIAPDTIRTPVLSVFRFDAHVVQIESPRIQFSMPKPTSESLKRQSAAIQQFLEDYVPKKGLDAVGHNVAIRRRHPEDVLPHDYFSRVVKEDVWSRLDSAADIGFQVQLTFVPAFSDRAQVRFEPSLVDDLEAVFFSFNFHFQIAKSAEVDVAISHSLSAMEDSLYEADRLANELLSAVGRDA